MDRQWWPPSGSQWALAGVVVALAAAALVYRAAQGTGLADTAVLFVGLPAVLALVVALTPKARSVTGMAMKATTIGLLLSMFFFGEGAVCILMAAPLFYAIAGLIGWSVDRARKSGQLRVWVVVPLVLALLSTEGATAATTLPRAGQATVTRTVAAGAAGVERALAQPPRLGGRLPAFLQLGFPKPLRAAGTGLAVGDVRVIDFSRHARHYAHHHGTLVMKVTERGPGRAVFAVTSDTTPMASWQAWRSAEVTWRETAPGVTSVTWSLRYDRLLDPGWYFGPMERYANTLAAGYLIDAAATPA
jgi:hypothetical protein